MAFRCRLLLPLLVLAGACAPVASLRSPSAPELRNQWEAGLGGAVLGPRPYAQESWQGTAQAWITGRLARSLRLSGVLAFDDQAAAAGAALQLDYFRRDRFVGALELELGWAFGGFALPTAVRLFDDTWIYTAPRIGTLGDELSGSLTVGMSSRLYGDFHLRAEATVSWAAFKYYNRRAHAGGGIAYQW